MTLAIDGRFEWQSDGERRSITNGPRKSWAGAQPYEPRAVTSVAQPEGVAAWSRTAPRIQRRLVVTDAAAAFAAIAPFLLLVYGVDVASVLNALLATGALVGLVAGWRGYETRLIGSGPFEYQAVLRAGATGAVLLMTASYVMKAEVSRLVVLAGIPTVIAAVLLARHVNRRGLHHARLRGEALKRTLLVGDAAAAHRVVPDLVRATYHGYAVTGICLPELDGSSDVDGVPVMGAVGDVPQVVIDRSVDVVLVAGPALSGEGLRRLSWALDRVGAELVVAPDLVEVMSPRLTLRPAAGLSLLEVEVAAPRRRILAKALLDRFLGAVLLVVATPVIAAAALAVRLTSPGPAFYSQTRVGVDGEPFTMWKLRSMFVDAEQRRAALDLQNEGAGVLFKIRQDPRVTPVGRLLRRYSLDELPQLLNVVRGDMSLVGPRPPLVREVESYEDAAHRRLRVKPGLTGLWQVSGRSDLSWEESVRLDLRYVDNWSVTMDLMILWKTARAVVSGSGAY